MHSIYCGVLKESSAKRATEITASYHINKKRLLKLMKVVITITNRLEVHVLHSKALERPSMTI